MELAIFLWVLSALGMLSQSLALNRPIGIDIELQMSGNYIYNLYVCGVGEKGCDSHLALSSGHGPEDFEACQEDTCWQKVGVQRQKGRREKAPSLRVRLAESEAGLCREDQANPRHQAQEGR